MQAVFSNAIYIHLYSKIAMTRMPIPQSTVEYFLGLLRQSLNWFLHSLDLSG